MSNSNEDLGPISELLDHISDDDDLAIRELDLPLLVDAYLSLLISCPEHKGYYVLLASSGTVKSDAEGFVQGVVCLLPVLVGRGWLRWCRGCHFPLAIYDAVGGPT